MPTSRIAIFTSFQKQFRCDCPSEIAAFLPKENIDGESVDVIDELTAKLYDGKAATTIRQKLISERNNLNSAVPLANWKWQRLTYLIAISYEMEGQTDQAIEAFTSVLRSKNQTLWGNLAELHLETK